MTFETEDDAWEHWMQYYRVDPNDELIPAFWNWLNENNIKIEEWYGENIVDKE